MEAYGTMFFEITVWMFLKNLYNGEYDKIQGRQNVKKVENLRVWLTKHFMLNLLAIMKG